MSKTLDTSVLGGFKPKVVNIDPSIIEGAKAQVELETVEKDNGSSDSSPANDELASSSKLEKEIERLKAENTRLKNKIGAGSDSCRFSHIESRSLRNNFIKLLDAIHSESKIQGTDWPTLSTNKLRKTYKVTSDSFSDCLDYGLENRYIDRKEKSYSGKVKTFAYKVLRSD